MTSYHVLVTRESTSEEKVELDLSPEELMTRIIEPYGKGQAIIVRSISIARDDIISITIREAIESTFILRKNIENKRKAASVGQLASNANIDKMIANKGKDVTDDFVSHPCSAPSSPESDS